MVLEVIRTTSRPLEPDAKPIVGIQSKPDITWLVFEAIQTSGPFRLGEPVTATFYYPFRLGESIAATFYFVIDISTTYIVCWSPHRVSLLA